MDKLRSDKLVYFEKYEILLTQKILLEASLELESKLPEQISYIDQIKEKEKNTQILKKAIEILKNTRSGLSNNIIKILENLLLKQIINLGFISISKITIDPLNFKISFDKNNEIFEFKDLSEGEQLRIKLALYLSIIEMDILYNQGRHPRFLILDAPTKEEADKLFVEGFGESLKKIEENFKDKLQIFIGTAKYELSEIISPEKTKILTPNQYLF